MWNDLYPTNLNTEGDPARVADADAVVYRLICERLEVPGLPEQVDIGDLTLHFIVGPVRTQITQSRQRAGLPFVFDKHMRRSVVVGDGAPLTVCQLRSPVPDDLAGAAQDWRDRADAALGLVAATLDERIAGNVLAEDMVLLRDGAAIAAADVHTLVRTFMPFDVTADDAASLAGLGSQVVSLAEPAARAAGLYLRAANEGPTRHGLLTMWLAVDALVAKRKTQKQGVAAALAEVGFDLTWLNLDLGRLVGVRGPIAHGKQIEVGLIRQAYRDTEAIARALIRHAASIAGGWPAQPSATAFRLPLGAELAEHESRWEVEWHDDGLPPAEGRPAPTGLDRADAVLGEHDQWIAVTGGDPDTQQRLRFWAMLAARSLDIEIEPFTVSIDEDGELPDGSEIHVNSHRILIDPQIANPDDEGGEVRLGYHLCRWLAAMQVLRLGVESEGFGAFLIELAGGWGAYRGWVVEQEMPAEFLQRNPLADANLGDLGAYAGIALAGDEAMRADLDSWISDDMVDQDLRDIVSQAIAELQGANHFSDVLRFISLIVEGVRGAQGEAENS